ncbi:MAG: RNA polymerase sigma factor region1.1 domain-containing protein, partial [Actinomycetes bacterium]
MPRAVGCYQQGALGAERREHRADAAVKKLIRTAKKRGYVTHDEINAVLPS